MTLGIYLMNYTTNTVIYHMVVHHSCVLLLLDSASELVVVVVVVVLVAAVLLLRRGGRLRLPAEEQRPDLAGELPPRVQLWTISHLISQPPGK